MKKWMKRILLALIVIFLCFWLLSLVKCELITIRHHKEFETAYQSNTMLDEMEYFKVLSCGEASARVYYVSKDYTDANILTFQKNDGIWYETGWITVWSAGGSASDVVWPYWWHFVFGGI